MTTDETSITAVQVVTQWIRETNIQAAIIGPLITGAGALIVSFFGRINNEKVCIARLVQEIEECAINHWCVPGADVLKLDALKIQNKLQTLSWKIKQNRQRVKDCFIAYRQAVTSHDFESTDRDALPIDDPRIELINNKARELRKALGIKKHH